MGKRIVVITGSPRKNGNSFAMTESFIKAAEEKGHSVVRFDAAFMRLNGCRACDACYSTGKACAFDDDFNLAAPEIERADAVVFTMPVYWYTIPAQIKCVIDKLYALYNAGRGTGGKECGLIACCEAADPAVLDGVRLPYEQTIALMGWKSVGTVLIPNVNRLGDIERTDGRKQAEALAQKF